VCLNEILESTTTDEGLEIYEVETQPKNTVEKRVYQVIRMEHVFWYRQCKLFIFNDITEVRLKKKVMQSELQNQHLKSLTLWVSHQVMTPITESI
jgi:hypothetical protein